MGFVISQIYPNDHRGIKQVKVLLEKVQLRNVNR